MKWLFKKHKIKASVEKKNKIIIFGIQLKSDKNLILALTALYGIGIATAKRLCASLGFSPKLDANDLTEKQQYLLIRLIKQTLRVENNLKDFVKSRIQRLIDNESNRGFRHRNRLPVRGQRTNTNAKTAKRVSMFKKQN